MTAEKKPGAVTRRDFIKGLAVGVVATAAVSAGVAAVSWPAAPPAPGVVTKTETVTKTTTAAAATTTVTAPAATTTVTTTAPAVTTTVTTTAPAPPPAKVYEKDIVLTINGDSYTLHVKNNWTLMEVIKEKLGFYGVKNGCARGECGACTVLIDGKPFNSCMILAVEAEGKKIETLEGIFTDVKLHPIQEAFIKYDALQCGFCTPGMIMSTKALLDKNPSPTREQVKEALAGNLCRCGAYPKIIEAVLSLKK